MWIKKNLEFIFLFFIGSVFLVLASQHITLPGLQYDEAVKPAIAMNILYSDNKMFNYVHLFGKDFFVMIYPHVGPIEVYSFLPFFYLLGVSLYSVRIAKIFWSLVEVVLFFYFAKEFFNRRIAYIASLLFATMPTVIFYSRQGALVNHMILIPLFLSFIFFSKFLKKRKISFFYLSSFFFGVGFTTKLTFWWLILPIILFVYFFRIKFKVSLWQAFVCFYLFCLGAAPIILYNITYKWETFRYILESPGTNVSILSNLVLRFTQFIGLLNGKLNDFSFGDQFSTYFFFFFSVSILVVFFYSLRNPKQNRNNFFFMSLIVLVLLQSIFTVSNLLELHLFMLVPICLLVSSYFLYMVFNKNKTIFFILFLLILFFNVFGIFSYYATLKRTGGTAYMSDAIYDLAEYLEQNGIYQPLAVDWGFSFNIRLLTNNKVKPLEIFVYPDREGVYLDLFGRVCYEAFQNPSYVYLFMAPSNTVFERFDTFKRFAENMGKKVVLEKIFYQKNGEPIYFLYRVLDS